MAFGETYFDNDGDSVVRPVNSAANKGDVVYVDKWLGIASATVASGDSLAITVDMRAYQFEVPSTLSVAAGDTVYVDTTSLTGIKPQTGAYGTSAGSNKIRLFRAIEDKDSNNVVIGILIGGLQLS